MRTGGLRPLSWALRSVRFNGLPLRYHSCKLPAPSFQSRQFATKVPDEVKKPYYVTSPIFYVNAGRGLTILNLLKKNLDHS